MLETGASRTPCVLAVVPAFQAEHHVGGVVRGLRAVLGDAPIIVVDDGSTDGTAREAETAGAVVVRHPNNRGKGAALRSGFARAQELGADAAVTVDADGQHPADEAARIALHPSAREAFVLGVRDLVRDGAPKSSRFSNGFSNWFLSWFGGGRSPTPSADCVVIRCPRSRRSTRGRRVTPSEAESLLRAARRGWEIVEVPVVVIYPPPSERVSHFHVVRDPARIIYRVLETTLFVPRRGFRHLFVRGLVGVALTVLFAHLAIGFIARPSPPALTLRTERVTEIAPGYRRDGNSYVLERDGLTEVGLRGSPEAIGAAHATLLRDAMRDNEGILLQRFDAAVPSRLGRALLVDLAQLRFRGIDLGMSPERRTEIAAGARAFEPDLYAGVLPTYQRFLYLNALYDIALSFERSTLVGCTSVAFHGSVKPEGGALLARAFDMEVDPVFDRKKAVFLVHEDGKLPFASVAWPGLVGVVSGMNRGGGRRRRARGARGRNVRPSESRSCMRSDVCSARREPRRRRRACSSRTRAARQPHRGRRGRTGGGERHRTPRRPTTHGASASRTRRRHEPPRRPRPRRPQKPAYSRGNDHPRPPRSCR